MANVNELVLSEAPSMLNIPVLPLRDVVVYPHMVIPLFVGREKSIKALEAAGITVDELGAFIPHQANIRIIETMAKEMKIPDSVLIADDIRTNGNTSAASIPLAMDRILEEHPELHGKLALLIGYGAGLVYAAQVVELPPRP